MTAYAYPIALAVISLGVLAAEAIWPWRKDQRQLRPWLWSDLVHLVFNAHFLGLILFGIFDRWLLPYVDAAAGTEVGAALFRDAARSWPLWVQIPVALVVIDFVQWCVHNLLHRVPALWELHKTHHSVQDGEMDWIVSFRFQWTEVVVYKTILYLPMAFFGFAWEAVMVHAVFGTLIGHLNHANLALDYGPLKYVLNHPKMHLWHHDYDGDSKTTVNFGIIFSTWDFLFGTAKISDAPPAHIGFRGVETFPRDFFRQAAWPLRLPGPVGTAVTAAAGVGVLGLGYWLQLPAPPPTPMLGEVAASSQPASKGAAFGHYPRDDAEATQALARFGEEAKAAGFAHPEAMVSADELARALGSSRLLLLDVRPAPRFAVGHIPGAVRCGRDDYSDSQPFPGLTRTPAELREMLRTHAWTPETTLVLTGDGGPEPYRLWWSLRESGVAEARVLDGGLLAWKQAGHGVAEGDGIERATSPSTASPSSASPSSSSPDAMPRLWAELEGFRGGRQPQLLDTRSDVEHTGVEQHPKAARAGRIPGSLHLDWARVLDEQGGTLKRPGALRDLFESAGLSLAAPVMTWCQSGTRSSAVYFALWQLGAPPEALMNYDGSWAEYSRLSDLDVETGPARLARARPEESP